MSRQWIQSVIKIFFGMLAMAEACRVFACEQVATTPLERLYCQVQAKGEGAGLPSFDDFRRNLPQTQKLLLKRPAKKAGLQLPKDPVSKPSPSKHSASKHSASRPSLPLASASKNAYTQPATRAPVLASLQKCGITGTVIECGNARYRLLDNLPNKRLSNNALNGSNILALPSVPEDIASPLRGHSSSSRLHEYLQIAYAEYLRKMQTIGLAGATLTYSKFYYIFEEGRKQNQDFVKRFGDMFTYLKKDKSTMAVGPRHQNKPQPALANCEPISRHAAGSDKSEFIVCDEKGVNWVYQLGL